MMNYSSSSEGKQTPEQSGKREQESLTSSRRAAVSSFKKTSMKLLQDGIVMKGSVGVWGLAGGVVSGGVEGVITGAERWGGGEEPSSTHHRSRKEEREGPASSSKCKEVVG